MKNWVGITHDATAKVIDGAVGVACLNEPNGCWAKVDANEEFIGLYIADTGNDCIRFAGADGHVETLTLHGVPDVRLTASDCIGGQCNPEFDSDDESNKEDESQMMRMVPVPRIG